MDVARWGAVRRIFESALELDPAERVRFVAAESAGDELLRSQVEELLRSSQDDDFLTPPLREGSAPVLASGPRPGDRIASYQLRDVIASGGMGTVYEAVQDQPHRAVALKMMRFGIADTASLRRFTYESEVLGRLRHPHIAQIHEAGTYRQDGPGGPFELPFFAMEYVENARDLVSYSDEENLTERQRLDLFQKVCGAVHYGHQKGVIHRDLKPGNILVDGAGAPKVIDFGVARAAEAEQVQTTLQSQPGMLIGTLQYMSPEQVKAVPGEVDTRSDVYSLGVILYRLLCGRMPYTLAGCPLPDIVRIIHDDPPESPRRARPTLPADLEWIVLRALEKDKDRRYASASELSADIGRYLAHEPVVAGPPGTVYRLRKFVRRHPAGAGMLVLLLLGLVGTTYGLFEATAARADADRQTEIARKDARRANAINAFVEHMFLSLRSDRAGHDEPVSALLDRAAQDLVAADIGDPLVEAQVRLILGQAYFSLTRYQAAGPQVQRARDLFQRENGPLDPSTLTASASLGLVLRALGRLQEAEEVMTATLAAQRTVLGNDDPQTLTTLAGLGTIFFSQGRYGEAREALAESVDGRSRVFGADSIQTLEARATLAAALFRDGGLEEAEETARQVVAGRLRHFPEDHPSVLSVQNTLAAILKSRGQYREARTLYEHVLAARRRLLGEDHESTLISINNLATLLDQLDQTDAARTLYEQALAVLERVRPESQATVDCHANLAQLLRRTGESERAVACYDQLLPVAEKLLPPSHWKLASYRWSCGVCLVRLGRFVDAEPLLLAAQDAFSQCLTGEDPRIRQAIESLVDLYENWGRQADADRWRARLEALDD